MMVALRQALTCLLLLAASECDTSTASSSYAGRRASSPTPQITLPRRAERLAPADLGAGGICGGVWLELAVGTAAVVPRPAKHDDEAAAAASGSIDVVCRNQTDCTDELQQALDDAAATQISIKHAKGRKWFTRPLMLKRSNVALVIESGVVLQARRGFFHGPHDTLLTITGTANVSLEGPGVIRMWREDYANASLGYSKAEWRAGLSLSSSSNLTVKHLTIANTGGDGMYVKELTDSRLHNVTTDGAYRNGLSIISAENLLVDRSYFLNTGHFPWSATTGGTAPRAGVDLEPNEPTDKLTNITFRECVAAGNTDDAYDVKANFLTTAASIVFERCVARDCAGGWGSAFALDNMMTKAPGSTVSIVDCTVSNMGGGALTIKGTSAPDGDTGLLHPVAISVNGLVSRNAATMWNDSYHGVDLGFFPLTFGGERAVINNPISLSAVTIHVEEGTKRPDQLFAGCHGMGWHPVPCDPHNLTALSGNVTVVSVNPAVCSKTNLGAAGQHLKVACTTAAAPDYELQGQPSSSSSSKTDDDATAIISTGKLSESDLNDDEQAAARTVTGHRIVYVGYHSPNLANLLPANVSKARWHAHPAVMDSTTPFDGTSFFFSPGLDMNQSLAGQCCYECCLQWACCIGYRVTVDQHRWSNGTAEAAALSQQATELGQITQGWRQLTRNSVWIPLVSQDTFAHAAPGSAWWFDDDRFAELSYNWAVAAAAAQRSGATQLFIDAEEYCAWCPPGVEPPNCREASNLQEIGNCSLFFYPDLLAFRNSSFAEFEAIATERGRQLLRAAVAVWPSLEEVSLTKGFGSTLYSFKWLPPGGDRDANLTQCEYSLLPAFLDGIMIGMNETESEVAATVAAGQKRVLTENYEDYYLHTRAEFETTFSLVKRGAAALSRHPALVKRYYRAGFGLSLDQKQLADGSTTSLWDTKNFSRNNFSPETLTTALRAAFEISDAPTAVWVWGTLMLPWLPSGEDQPMGLPAEYAQAIRAAKQLSRPPLKTDDDYNFHIIDNIHARHRLQLEDDDCDGDCSPPSSGEPAGCDDDCSECCPCDGTWPDAACRDSPYIPYLLFALKWILIVGVPGGVACCVGVVVCVKKRGKRAGDSPPTDADAQPLQEPLG